MAPAQIPGATNTPKAPGTKQPGTAKQPAGGK